MLHNILPQKGKGSVCRPCVKRAGKRGIRRCGICLVLLFIVVLLRAGNVAALTGMAVLKAGTWKEAEMEPAGPYAADGRLEMVSEGTYSYDKKEDLAGGYLYDQYMWVMEPYSEEEMAEFTHASFDDKNRICYMLGYTPAILTDAGYCEEQIFDRDDLEHTCRHIYYKANSSLYQGDFYVAYRYLFDVCYYQFTEDGRLLSRLDYSREAGSDLSGYGEELFYNRGYRAEYDGERLMEELVCYNFWGTNEAGSWEHRAYQYNEQGDCILKVVTTEDEILVLSYEYDEADHQVSEYIYRVKENWEFTCEDGSVMRFQAAWGSPAVEKRKPDGTVEKAYVYGRVMDLGQEAYLMPEDVEETVDDHTYVVKPGDNLWNIARRHYGNGGRYELIYYVNRERIGADENLILPGTRLYVPETGNEQDT